MPLVLLFLLLSASSTQSTLESDLDPLHGISAEFSPKDPLFASGSTMELNCTLTMSNTTPPDVTAHQVYCTFGSANLMVVVLNDTTFKIRQENLTRNMSHGHVFCYLNVMGKAPFAQVSIRVADIPVAPKVTSCVVHNWEKMVCIWEPPTQDTGIPTNYTLAWSVLGDRIHPCKCQSGNTCVLSKENCDGFMMDMTYRMQMVIENELKKVYSPSVYFATSNLVKPNKVNYLRSTDITSQSAEMIWTWGSGSYTDNGRLLLFRVNYTSEWDTGSMETRSNNTVLSHLVPNTNYVISIECIPLDNITRHRQGFWSDAEGTSLLTKEDVPGRAPAFAAGSYTYSATTTSVFWQPVPRRWLHGNLIRYRIRCFHYANRSHVVAEKFEQDSFSELIVPSGQEDLAVTVEAETAMGYNNSLDLKTLVIPRADRVPAKPGMVHAVRNQSEITAMWSSVSNGTSYTVYWCKKSVRRQHCETSLDWTSVSPDVTSLTISVGTVRHNDFLIAVSMETYVAALGLNVSSGMVWAGCVPDISKHAKPPTSVVFVKEQQPYSLTVEWSKPKCEDTAHIVKFEILYCQRQGCGVDGACCNNKTMVVENNETVKDEMIAVIRDLVADVEYEVSMRSISFTENSTYTPPIRHTVRRSGLTAGVIAAIVIGALVLFFLLVIGLVTITKQIKKFFGRKVLIEPPKKYVCRMPCQSEQAYNDQAVVYIQRNSEEGEAFLHDESKQETDAWTGPVNIRSNGKDCMSESLQPLVTNNGTTHLPGRDELPDSGVPPSHDSTISSYAHVTVPDDGSHAPNKQPNSLVENGHIANPSSNHSPRVLPSIATDSPSKTLDVAEPPISSGALTETYMPVENISLPSGSCTSSTIAPYTTVEQTFEMADLKNCPESRGRLPADAEGDATRQAEMPLVESRDTKPYDYRQIQCQVDDDNSGSLAGVSDMTGNSPINTANNGGVVTEIKPLYANHDAPVSEDGYSDQRDIAVGTSSTKKPLLPVGYIPLAPTLST